MIRGATRGTDPGVGASSDGSKQARVETTTQLTIRVVHQLAVFGHPREDGIGRREATQAGIADSLSTSQGAVSWILSRLRAAGVVRYEVGHVPGGGRRVRVYTLTRAGEILEQEIEASWSKGT